MRKEISYVMAPETSFYSGMVMRRVTSTLENGLQVILSETTTGMELDEFQEKYPTYPVDGQRGDTIRNELSYMTDAQLEAMGLKRIDENQGQKQRPTREPDGILAPTYTYPVHDGHGWYSLSTSKETGNRAKGKVDATRRQKAIDAGKPDPEDEIIKAVEDDGPGEWINGEYVKEK
jgi:hypothetical protein